MNKQATYNLVSLVWHPNSSERLHVGLFMNDGQKVLFQYNPNRLEAASKLLQPDDLRLVKATLHDLKAAFASKKQTDTLHLASEWGEDKMSYLHRYSTNLIQIESTTAISLELNEANFKKLFEKYLGVDSSEKIASSIDLEKRISKIIRKKLKARTSIDLKLDSTILPGLMYPMAVPSIGMNEVPFVCEVVNFEKRVDSVTQKIGDMFNLQDAFGRNNMKGAKFFAVGNEPSKADKTAHQIWTNLRSTDWIDFVPEHEMDKVIDYAEAHDVQPWVAKRTASK